MQIMHIDVSVNEGEIFRSRRERYGVSGPGVGGGGAAAVMGGGGGGGVREFRA